MNDINDLPQTGYAQVNGLNMYYEIHGSGHPLVLIHGGGSTIQSSFGTILPLLARRYRVIAPELQAHGRTSDRDAPESFEQDADDVAALCRHLHIDRAHFLGFSNGANTAMQVTMRHEGLVDRLVIVSGFYKREGMVSGFFEGMELASLDNMPAELKQAFLECNPDPSALRRMFEKDRARMLHFKDWRDEDLALIKAPALVVVGDKDVMTVEHSAEMCRKLPDGELLVLPGTHGSFIGEVMYRHRESRMPSMVVEIIDDFLNK